MQKYPNISRASHHKSLFLTPCRLAGGLGPHGGGSAIWTTWPVAEGERLDWNQHNLSNQEAVRRHDTPAQILLPGTSFKTQPNCKEG